MLNLRLLVNFFTVVFLVLIQSLIFNRINFEHVATPYIYVIFILLYHPNKNRYIFLLLCFFLGWGIDMFYFTGGIHAFASISMGKIGSASCRERCEVRVVGGGGWGRLENERVGCGRGSAC